MGLELPTQNDAAVTFEDVSVSLGGVPILDSIRAQVPSGSATAIIGPNGAGKTTLLLALLGQIPYRGSIHVRNVGASPRLGYVPQRLEFDRGMPLTVMDLMVMGRQRLPLWFGARRRPRQEALATLEAVRAAHLHGHRMGSLSGGELQRVLLALAIQQEPDILILDEPSAGVDIGGESLLCELLETLRPQKGFTQIMVTHDLSLVTAHATYVICLNRRVMGQGTPRETLTEHVLAATFGIHLGLADLSSIRESRPLRGSCGGEGHTHD